MKKLINQLHEATKIIEPLAVPHIPKGTTVKAVIHQWLHAIASHSQFFCDRNLVNPDILKNDVIHLLRQAGIYKSREQFYELVFANLKLKPNLEANFKFIDLFAGIGGIRLGAQRNNGVCVFSSEFDSFAQATYELNHGEEPFGDITSIDASNIPDHDLLLAGFPCQPFSYSGRCEGFEDKTRGTLFFDVLRVLEVKKPKYALLENVKGFKSHDKGNTMFIALNALKEAGYKTYWSIVNSYDFGVPQYRERWYCIAVREDIQIDNFIFPNAKKRGTTLRDIVDIDNNDESLKISKFELERIDFHFKNSHKAERVEHNNSMYETHTKKGRHGVFSYLKPDGSLRFHVGDVAKTQIQEAFYACLDTYAPTIIANRVPKLWDIQRKLSVRESARLQGFPEEFQFEVSNAQAYKQLGNSVTVTVIEELLKQLLNKETSKCHMYQSSLF
ncbi:MULTISPECIES: DNA cytosine methyltransferase [Acinetobacter]|uniref:DNA cytosine methyltransferase n=1 Tax=Acinetobacter TaxID=469 RepID=UPI0002DB978D|nr:MULTISPECIES: DNA cytosine methyltransferase [Acinetobacter]EHU2509964.1 DNA (cytosine-5-)-methyltransferase [Acinetobacter baumannii]KQG04359.1 cytosine methyltransferase [Acinetobacter pittii]MBJ8466800.1 DNA (cytosine-5-)-methyltransferase [Acinetobacter pittii]MBK1432225.1 DNA (cytosine-5-)-methyltransferase [Acinetobacter pittii]MBK1436336.1 DNA (cytosine-5-)-methyltransferase [Acinetobacter pittii]